MANNSPTLVMASLSDDQLKKSIDSLVTHVNEAMKKMVQSTNNAVGEMEAKLKSLGNIRIDTDNTSDGGSSKRTKKQQEETQAVKETVSAHKELVMTLDQEAAAIQKASGRKKGIDYISLPSDVDKSVTYLINANKDVDTQMAAILQRESALVAEKQKEIQATEQAAQATRMSGEELRKIYDEQKKVNDEINKRANGIRTGGATPFQSYDSLRQSIAAVLGIQEQQVKMANTETDSYKKLSSTLTHLKQAYDQLGHSDRNSDQGKALVASIHEVERAMQKIRAQAARPVSLESIIGINGKGGLSEKTLDDIAYKMRQLASYRSGLNVETRTKEITQVNDEYNRLKKRMDEVMQKNQQMVASNTALGRSWNYMKNRLAFYFTVGASTSFVKSLIEIRGQYELLDRSIGILIDSAQNGSQIFAELNAMAIKSPFTTMELGAAAKQLVAYDVAAKDVVDTTRRLADMAAAVGIPIERLTYALGQIKAYGYLNARDARMFANAGIPLVKELADYYTELEGRLVSTADVYDRIKKKAIDYSDVMNVVNKMTDEGGKFFDFQEKAADTLKVRIANLTLAWNNMLNEMGKDNQGILTEGLKVTKQIFESWRDINNMVIALGFTYGTIKAAQIAYYLWVMRTEKAVGAWSKIINAIDYAFNAKIANAINSLKTSLVGFFTNPAAMLAVAFTALSVALTKAYLDYRDLQSANEEFNKSVVKNAEENVKSIDKFFGDYKKQLESVGSLNSADQTKLWERVQEEIEKTTKNAEKYIEILNKIPEISKRIEVGESVLEQSKRIQDELKYMAERGMFNIGGGFANDSAAKDLQQYSDAVNELITKYGDLDNAKKEALKVNEITLESGETIRQYTGEYADFQRAQIEAEKELQNIVSTLDKVNMAEILGTGDMETQLANVRSFAIAWRDAFLATEKGSKISAEGQALLNSYIDKWVEQQARVNHLIKDENTAAVEANRTAWETFFKFLNTEERKRLDVAIKTNQLGSKSVQELWDNAAERMQEKATTSYNLIQQQIADLRNTPDIVINVVYRNNKEKLEKDQEEFEKKYIQPKDWGVLSTDEYLKQEKANREKYGTLMRKQGEDTAEYEKRISDERKSQLELQKRNGDIIEENKNKTDDYSRAVTEQAKKEKQAADDRLKVIKDVEDAGGYDFSTKSERAAANKAQKAAESELQKALKEEISLLDKARSTYKSLKKEGVSSTEAIAVATSGYEKTLAYINNVLSKYGIAKVDITKYAGVQNPKVVMDMLQAQLDTLSRSGLVKPEEIKDLVVKLKDLKVDAVTFNQKTLSDSLNNELSKLKDEYEIGLEFDATPELGSMFQQMMGLSDEELAQLPKDFEGVVKKLQSIVDTEMGQGKFDVGKNLNKKVFDQYLKDNQIDVDSDLANRLRAMVDFANDVRQEETKKQIDDWDKLLEKYAEYEYKRNKITEDAERERQIARKKGASQDILNAIDIRERQQLAKLDMEEFMKTSTWITATGDLSTLSSKAIGVLIDRLEDYKKHAKDLDPKQIKQLNSALSKLYKEQRKNNPFRAISDMLAQARERFLDYEREINQTAADYAKLSAKAGTVGLTGDEEKLLAKLIKRIKELKQEQEDVSTPDAEQWVASIQTTIAAVKEAIGVFQDLAKAINGVNGDDDLDKALSVLDKAASSAATGAAVAGGWGAAIGAVIGTATGLLTTYIDKWNGNAGINKAIEKSERAIKRLELAYVDLEHAVSKAYGTEIIGAKRALAAAKELELAELERQLRLEQSRKSKNRDNDKILDLQKQIKELRYEIQDSIEEITDDLLGSDVGSFAENLVSSMIDAFKQGEDYMKVFEDKFDEMIDNMIMKSIVSRIITAKLDQLWNDMTKRIDDRTKQQSEEYAAAKTKREELENQTFEEWVRNQSLWDSDKRRYKTKEELLALWEAEKEAAKQAEESAKAALDAADDITDEDILSFIAEIEKVKPEIADTIKAALNQWYTFGEDSEKKLSALQQGIQGVTEDTAGALEAITNSISQQSYLQSDLLTQIRDAVVSMDMDVSLGVMSQILLQLQSSYQIQQSMLLTMENWTNPSGNAVRVELIS